MEACKKVIRSGEFFGKSLAPVLNNRGIGHAGLDDHRKAVYDFSQALHLDPNFSEAYHNRGFSHALLGKFNAAVDDWEQAIPMDGKPRVKWWQEYLIKKGHYSGAIDGEFSPDLHKGLVACARDLNC